MKGRFAPVTRLVWSQAQTVRELRAQIAGLARQVDSLRGELAVQRTRTRRWRSAAIDLASCHGERALAACDFQAMSDDLSDLPEVER